MDIIGCRFQEVMYQQKKHMARVSDLYRERVRSIKTVLHVLYREREFIVWRNSSDILFFTTFIFFLKMLWHFNKMVFYSSMSIGKE